MLQEAMDFLKKRQKLNLFIVILNLCVFLIFNMIGNTEDIFFMAHHGAMAQPFILENHEYYRLITCMFLHFNIEHVVYNMILLLFAGDMLEFITGKFRYLIIFFGGGLAGNILSLLVSVRQHAPVTVSAGASGAVFAVIGGLIWICITNRRYLRKEFIQRILLMTVLSLADGFSTTGVDNMAHLGGFLGGFALCMLLNLFGSYSDVFRKQLHLLKK